MKRLLGVLAVAALLGAAPGGAAAATPAPAWSVSSVAVPTNFKPGDNVNDYYYELALTNKGGAPTDGSPIVVTDTLPTGLGVKSVDLFLRSPAGSVANFGSTACSTVNNGGTRTVTCTVTEALAGALQPAKLWPSEHLTVVIRVFTPLSVAGTLANQVQVQGGGASPVTVKSQNAASAKDAPPGFSEFYVEVTDVDGQPASQAASHPYQYTTGFAVNTKRAPDGSAAPVVGAGGNLKDIEIALPPGLIGNPNVTTRCTPQQFTTVRNIKDGSSNVFANECPNSSVAGVVYVRQLEGVSTVTLRGGPLYNLVPPKGMPAQLGFSVAAPIYIDTSLRSGGDYGISAHLRNTSEAKRVTSAMVTVWGTPDDPLHDRLRGYCELEGVSCAGDPDPKPFLRLPTSCASALPFQMGFDSWASPGSFLFASDTEGAPGGCDLPEFDPSFEARTTTEVADSPTGLQVDLHLPQADDPAGLGSADLRDATVTLPEGLLVNPASADGLEGCSSARVDLDGAGPAQCPSASKLANVEVDTPLIDHPLPGAVYLAQPFDNPFGSLIAIYIAVDDPQSGIVVKLAGEVSLDPATGRLTTTFADSPQTPFEDFRLDFFGGPRASLRTPALCGTHTTTTQLRPHTSPASGPDATPFGSFGVIAAPGGGPCPASEAEQPHSPSFAAGSLAPVAGAYSPFVVDLRRGDGSQALRGLTVELPPGLTGKLAGVPYCPESALAAAAASSGVAERANPSCPAASRVGSVTVGAGAGPSPLYVAGDAYLAGPYRGAPLSLAVATPAVAGPFDLGTVVVRSALRVDPRTAQVSAASDPFPTILQGIPLDVRSISLRVDRPGFTLNPTSCDPSAVRGEALSVLGRVALLLQRFQVGGCRNLRFAPRLSMRLAGGTRRGAHPELTAVVRPRPGDANIARAAVSLPRSAFLDQDHIRTICTRVQFAADNCPKGAIYGKAVARSPLLDEPLRGPVYLRSSDNELPDLVASLRGQVEVELVGRIDSIRGGIRVTFDAVPDAPVSRFVMTMQGGNRGLLVNSRNVCADTHRATANFTAQNGRVKSSRPPLESSACAKKARGAERKQRR